MVEQWKPVAGFEGAYEVSDRGRVRSLQRVILSRSGQRYMRSGRILRHIHAARGGYPAVSLWSENSGKTCVIHRLMALAFLGPPPDGHEVHHIDGDKINNVISNLRWVTRSENVRHAIDDGFMPRRGEGNPMAKITRATVHKVRRLSDEGMRRCDVAKRLGLRESHVSLIATGRLWRHL